jgi:hypothetical protein
MAATKNIGPFVRGMNTLADETSLPADQCRSAKNLDFDKDGNFDRRQGFVRLIATTAVHSLYPSADNLAHIFGCKKNWIGYFDILNYTFTPLVEMPKAFRTSWEKLDNYYYASNPAFNCKIDASTYQVSTVAVPLPPVLSVASLTSGGMREGTYTVAYSIANALGEESPLGPETRIAVSEGGGIAISGVPLDSSSYLRIYISPSDGEELYRAIETPLIATSFIIGHEEATRGGAQPETRFLEELPYGHFIVRHGSRLMVASDNMLAFSNAFRPHLWDPRHNFILFESLLTMVVSVDQGVFVSDSNGVSFLAGDDVEQFRIRGVDTHPAIYGSVITIPGSHINSDLSQYDSVAVWLCKTGHVAGLPNGSILRLNPGQLDLPAYTVASSAITRRDGIKRVVIPVNSNRWNGTGTAIDSDIT